jgi:biotin transporter BioY
MTSKLIYSVAYIVGAVICFSIWKRHRDRNWLWFTWLAIIGGTLEVANYLVNILESPSNIIAISNIAILVFDPIEIFV